ncbi:MAG: ATP-binding protein [Gemmatimonadaceae bacterium]
MINVDEITSIIDLIPDAVRTFDTGGLIVRANARARNDYDTLGIATLGDLWTVSHPRTLAGAIVTLDEHPVARALRGEDVRNKPLAVRRGGASAPEVAEFSASPLRDGAGRIAGAVAVERDVTERIRLAHEVEEQVRRSAALYERVSTEAGRLERMVQARTDELRALEEARAREGRLAALGQLAAGVMHDVNNALNPIVAASYLLSVHANDPVAVRDYATRIARAAETGAATAVRVGRFIRQEPLPAGDEELVDLSTITDEVIAMTRPLWTERARGSILLERTSTTGVLLRGIAGELREALLNLVQNALDAMRPNGGTLGLVTRIRGGRACVEVVDSGTGMTPEVRERAFEPFFTTKGYSGTGLGLSEVYGIVKRHRGVTEIDSVPGAGTTVRLLFPLAHDVEPPRTPLPHPRVIRRILLVEDNDGGRELMHALLASDGHTVESVATMDAAVRRLGLHAAGNASDVENMPFDVLITDIGLPDGSGLELAERARRRWPALRVGVVTGWELRTATGDVHFTLRKPIHTAELLAQVVAES